MLRVWLWIESKKTKTKFEFKFGYFFWKVRVIIWGIVERVKVFISMSEIKLVVYKNKFWIGYGILFEFLV